MVAAAAHTEERDDGGNDQQERAEHGEYESQDRRDACGGQVDVDRGGGEWGGELNAGVAVAEGEEYSNAHGEASDGSYENAFHTTPPMGRIVRLKTGASRRYNGIDGTGAD